MRKVEAEKMEGMAEMSPEKKHYPSIYLDNTTLPEAKEWKVGKVYDVKLRLRMTGFSMRKHRDGKEHGNSDFEVVGIEPGNEVKGKVERYP
jgi:hypothetical protein